MTVKRRAQSIRKFLTQRKDALDFRSIADPRQARGQRWSPQALFSTAVLSLMMFARSLRSAERLSEELAETQRACGISRRVPDSTLGDFLSEVNPAGVRKHLQRMILAEHRRKALEPMVLPIRAIAVDGKTTATLDNEANSNCQKNSPKDGAPYWLHRVLNATLISSTAAVCIDQKPIPADTNDMGAFASFFGDLIKNYDRADLFELVTADAGFTSEANARLVDDKGKAYAFALKGNQPDLEQEARRFFAPILNTQPPEAETDWEQDSSRGWVKRQIWRTTELAQWGDWSHLRQVIMVRVLRRPGLADREGPIQILEERLYLTNLPHRRITAKVWLDLVRAHWRIENNLHGTLDIQWHEDHGHWVQRKNGLPVVALLRALAYNLLSLLRAVHLRSEEARDQTWSKLRDSMRDALVWATKADSAQTELEAVTATI